MTMSPADLDRLSADERRVLLADLLRNKQRTRSDAPGLIAVDPAARYEPFPLTDTQYAYWLGQQGLFALGNVSTHTYFEFEAENLDVARAERAFNRLIGYHDMLRAVIGNDGSQRILKDVGPFRIRTQDLREAGDDDAERGLLATRSEMSHQVLAPDRWPLFDLRATLFGKDRVRLHVSLNLLIVDAWSIRVLFAQWFTLYDHLDLTLPALELSFRDYVLAEVAGQDDADFRRAEAYWRDRLPTLPPAPDLPLAKKPGDIAQPRFVRFSRTLDEKHWSRLKNAARAANLTPSGLLLAAFGSVLRRWSQIPRFTINATVFNRRPLHPQILELVGDFTSTMLVTFDGSAETTFLQSARTLQQQFWSDLDHCQYSGIRVLRELTRLEGRSVSSYTPVVFTSIFGTGAPAARLLSAGRFVYGISQTPQVWLDHQVMEQGETLVLTWDAVAELFPDGLLGEMFEAYGDLLHRLAFDPTAWDQEAIPRIPQAQQRVRDAANDTRAPLTDDCLHSLFARSAAASGNRQAVIGEGRRLTYDQVLHQASHLTRRLREKGARPGQPVAIALPKGCNQVVAALGILESGAVYLPVDPAWPGHRLQQVLEIGEVETVVTTSSLAASLSWPPGVRCLTVDDDAFGEGVIESRPATDPDSLAYVMFTSGSTGAPKGVMTDHRGAVNTILDINERFGIGPDDRVLALSELHFDLSVYDIFGLLAAGGAVVFPEPAAARDPHRWMELIQQERVTVWNTVPALMEMLVEHLEGRRTTLDSLRLVLLSGDWIPVSLPDRVRRIAPNARVISLGGATEASIWSICYPIENVDPNWTSIPYGKALRNQGWHVLNEHLQDCPTWVPGDLHISGAGLAQGYWRDEKKTAERFIIHPTSGERLYRTGDRGRFLPDGQIEFLGRVDNQIKIRGHRIELGEIECALASHPMVQRAVVAAIGKERSHRHLVGYVVLRKNGDADGTAEPNLQELRDHVEALLPGHMVPTEIVCLDELPLTANGKVNRDLLPAPASVEVPEVTLAAVDPNSPIGRISTLIAKELGLRTIAPDANLLHLGADSVDMVRIANKIETEFGFQPSLAEFFRNPTVNELAAAQSRNAATPRDQAVPPAGFAVLDSKPQLPTLILDPKEREAFKSNMPGLRPIAEGHSRVALEPAAADLRASDMRAIRRSQRSFATTPLPAEALGHLLANLRRLSLGGAAKYRYGSAGGLYPVQTYVHVKHGRVESLVGGVYYYHPIEHTLVALAPGAGIDPEVHEPFINRGMFEQAAFSIFLIAQLNAIEPLYGEHALRFCMIEAGLIAQLLETEAGNHGIGLCQIGWMDFDRIRGHFLLDNGHRLVHSLVGGPLPHVVGELETGESHVSTPAIHNDREEGEI